MWGDIAITFLLAFITTYVFTPYSIRLARKVKALDIPKDKRKIHKKIKRKFYLDFFIISLTNDLISVIL